MIRLIYWLRLKRAMLFGVSTTSVDLASSDGDFTVYSKVWLYKGHTYVEKWWVDTETRSLR